MFAAHWNEGWQSSWRGSPSAKGHTPGIGPEHYPLRSSPLLAQRGSLPHGEERGHLSVHPPRTDGSCENTAGLGQRGSGSASGLRSQSVSGGHGHFSKWLCTPSCQPLSLGDTVCCRALGLMLMFPLAESCLGALRFIGLVPLNSLHHLRKVFAAYKAGVLANTCPPSFLGDPLCLDPPSAHSHEFQRSLALPAATAGGSRKARGGFLPGTGNTVEL